MLEMKIPSPGESITEVEIASWLVEDGDYVERDQAIAEIDSDKATLELPAEESGTITLKAQEGDTIQVGAVVCIIDTSAKAPANSTKKEAKAAAPETPKKEEATPSTPAKSEVASPSIDVKASPVAKEIITQNALNAGKISGSGANGRITKSDVLQFMSGGITTSAAGGWGGTRETRREKMSMLRRKVAERLVGVKNDTAMLTTFNEVDMKPVMDLRAQYKDKFRETHDVNLGFMSFFTKAVMKIKIIII